MHLSDQIEGEVWLKLDSMQRTTSFKFRGALNKILSLTEAEFDKGVVSASTGNYALAVAEAMKIRGRRATIYVAEDLEPSRLELLRSHGLDLVIHGKRAWDAEKEARRLGKKKTRYMCRHTTIRSWSAGRGHVGTRSPGSFPTCRQRCLPVGREDCSRGRPVG
jgi:threonine dehydratase